MAGEVKDRVTLGTLVGWQKAHILREGKIARGDLGPTRGEEYNSSLPGPCSGFKKKKRFFGKGSFFSKKSKDKTNQKKQATSSNPSLSNVNMIEKKPSEQSSQPQIKNDTIQQKQKPKRSSKKKFSFFSSGKKKKYKKPSTKKTDKQQMKTDVKKETKLNQEKNNDKNRSQSKKNPDSSQDQESFAQYSLDDDVKKILSITDELLAQLPDQVIEDFASSEDFQLYQKVMSKYQIK